MRGGVSRNRQRDKLNWDTFATGASALHTASPKLRQGVELSHAHINQEKAQSTGQFSWSKIQMYGIAIQCFQLLGHQVPVF